MESVRDVGRARACTTGVTIRIGPDGTLYFHDIAMEMLPVALTMCPENEELKQRAAAANRMKPPDDTKV